MRAPLFAVAILSYLTAITIALPLGVPGIVSEDWALIPLAVGAISLGLAMAADVRRP
jgi:hypothetical protein